MPQDELDGFNQTLSDVPLSDNERASPSHVPYSNDNGDEASPTHNPPSDDWASQIPSPVKPQFGKTMTPLSKISTMHTLAKLVQNRAPDAPVNFRELAPVASTTAAEASVLFAQLLGEI
jgi:hypothetical protein